MSSKKQPNLTRKNETVARDSAADIARRESNPRRVAPETKTTDKTIAQAFSEAEQKVVAQAKADAGKVKNRLHQTYNRALASELQAIMTEDPSEYFRFEIEALPEFAAPQLGAGSYLETIDCEAKALPAAN